MVSRNYSSNDSGRPRYLIAISVLLVLILAGAVCTWLFLLRSAQPDAGHEIVLVHKPKFFGHGGVDPTPVSTGLTYVWWTTDRIDVNMQPQQFDADFDDLMSKDGVPLDFHAVIRLQVTNSVQLISDFGPGWYKNNVEAEFYNRVRQSVRQHGMNETAIDTAAIEEIDNQVSAALAEYIKTTNLPLRLIDVTVGKANPPQEIKNQRVATATEEQRKNTEIKRNEAEQSRKAAELSRAEADNAYRNAMGLSPNLFVQLESVKMQGEVCKREGARCTFIIGDVAVTPSIPLSTATPAN